MMKMYKGIEKEQSSFLSKVFVVSRKKKRDSKFQMSIFQIFMVKKFFLTDFPNKMYIFIHPILKKAKGHFDFCSGIRFHQPTLQAET